MEPIAHYDENRDTYTEIAHSLNAVRKQFENSDRFIQRVMLFDATTYAVMSVQNSVEMLRRGFTAYANADSWDDVQDACRGLNYGKNKYRYIRENFETVMSVDEPIDLLEAGDVRSAVDIIADEFMGVSYVKAAFTVAMLGFTETLCVDTNIRQAVGDSVDSKGHKSIDDYYEDVDAVLNEFDALADEVDPFLVQWIVFDVQREDGIAIHDEYFDHMLPGTPFGRQMGLGDF